MKTFPLVALIVALACPASAQKYMLRFVSPTNDAAQGIIGYQAAYWPANSPWAANNASTGTPFGSVTVGSSNVIVIPNSILPAAPFLLAVQSVNAQAQTAWSDAILFTPDIAGTNNALPPPPQTITVFRADGSTNFTVIVTLQIQGK